MVFLQNCVTFVACQRGNHNHRFTVNVFKETTYINLMSLGEPFREDQQRAELIGRSECNRPTRERPMNESLGQWEGSDLACWHRPLQPTKQRLCY